MYKKYTILFLFFCFALDSFCQVVTEELRVKGVYLKVQSGGTAAASGATTTNNYDSGILKVEGTFTAEENVVNANSATIQVDGTLNVKGHWTNDATASTALAGATVGTVAFTGTANQNVGGTGSTTFENLTVSNASGITLTTSQTVANVLTFTSGKITTGAFRLDMTGTSADNISGYGTGMYVYGTLRRYVIAGVDYNLPIGSTSNYELAGLYMFSQVGLTYVDATFTVGAPLNPGGLTISGALVDNLLDYGYWTLTPDAGSAVYNVTVQSTGHTDLGGTQDNYGVITDYLLGGGWQSLGTHSSSTQSYSATTVLAKRQVLTTFGRYSIGHTATVTYVPPVVTEEFRNKGTYFKVGAASTAIASGATTTNNYDSGYLKVLGTFTAEENVMNANSANIQVDGTLNVKGDWTNNATASTALAGATIGTIAFTGSANQNVGGTGSTTFESLTVSNAAGITLTTTQTVANVLTFTAGKITTGAFRLDMTGTSADNTSGYGTGMYVYGTLRRYVIAGVDYNLPIGSTSNYELAGLYMFSQVGLTYVDATFTVGAPLNPGGLTISGALVDNLLDYGYWTLTPDAGSAVYNVTVQSTGHTDLGGIQDNYGVITDYLLGGGWQSLGTHSSSTQNYSATTVLAKRQILTTFGRYSIGHTATVTYTAPVVTEEFRNKGTYFKVAAASTAIASGATTTNNYDSGYLKVLGTFTAEENVMNANSANIQVDGTLNVKGDWTNNATASTSLAGATVGTVAFTGTANQNVGGTGSTTFESLTVSNAAGITLTTTQTVANVLTFTSGKITTGAFRLDMTGTSADNTSGYGTGMYVYGTLRRYVIAGVDYNLPIGSTSNYELAGLYMFSQVGLTYVDATFTVGAPVDPGGLIISGALVDNLLDYGYWTLTPDAGSAVYNVTVQSTGHTDLGGTQDNYGVITDYLLGGGWQSLGTHSSSTQSYSATTVLAKRQVLTTFGRYSIGHTATVTYVPPVVTEEFRNKGTYFKVEAASTAIASGATTTNNYDSGYLKVLGTFTAEENVMNANSANIQVDGTLNVKGDWTNNATASTALAGATIGTIAFTGSANQNVGGTGGTTFESLTVSNASGITLTTTQTVANVLTFTAGKITTGAFRLDMTGTSADNTSGYGTGMYVYGTLRRYVIAGVDYNLPIGSTSNYELAGLYMFSVSGGLTYVDATFTVGAPVDPGGLLISGALVDNLLDYGYWTLTPNAGSAVYNVTVQSTGHTDLGGIQDNYGVITDYLLGGGWQSLGTHSSATQNYSATTVLAKRQILSTFGRYCIGHTATVTYVPPVITEELRNKGTYFKIPATKTVVVAGTTTDVNNTSSGTIRNAGSLLLEGSWNNSATAVHTSGILQFQGAGVQTFGEASSVTMDQLIINKSANDLTLTGDIAVTTSVTMTSGDLVLGTNDITVQNGTTISGGSTTSHIVATSSGAIVQNLTATGTNYNFPVGDGTNYTPLTFRLNTGTLAAANLAITLTDAAHPLFGAPTSYITRFWTLTPTGITGTINYDVTFRYVAADVVGTEASIIPWKYHSPSAWSSGGSLTIGTKTLSWSGITSFSDVTGIDAGALPIELLSFNATKNENVVDVFWTTATEINNDYFTVERSQNAVYFEEVVKVDGVGNSTSTLNYSTVDEKPYQGISYYRLKQTDFDGKYAYSQIVPVEFNLDIEDSNFLIYPNPNNGSIISLLAKELQPYEELIITIKDMNNKKIVEKNYSADAQGVLYTTIENLVDFADGIYIVTLKTQSKIYHRKLIIQ